MQPKFPLLALWLAYQIAAISITTDVDDFLLKVRNENLGDSPFVVSSPASSNSCNDILAENKKLRAQLQTVKAKLVELKDLAHNYQLLQDENSKLEVSMGRMKADLNACNDQASFSGRKTDDLRSSFNTCQQELQRAKFDIQESVVKIKSFQKIADDLRNNSNGSAKELEKKNSDLTFQVGSLEIEASSAKQETKQCRSENQAYEGQIKNYESQISLMKSQESDFKVSLFKCQDDLVSSSKANADAKNQLTSLRAEVQGSKEENTALQLRLNSLEDTIQTLNNCQAALQTCGKDSKDIASKLSESEAAMRNKTEILAGLQSRIEDLGIQLNASKATNTKTLEDWQTQVDLFQKCQQGMLKQTQILSAKDKEIDAAGDKNKQLSLQLAAAQQQLSNLSDQNKSKDASISNLKDQLANCSKLKADYDALQATIGQLTTEINQKTSRLEDQASQLSKCSNDLTSAKTEASKANSTAAEVVKKLTGCQSVSDGLQSDIGALKKKVEGISVENQKLSDVAAQPCLKAQLLEARIADLEKMLLDSKNGANELNNCKNALASANKELGACQEKNQALNSQLGSFKDILKGFQDNLEAFKTKQADLDARLRVTSDDLLTCRGTSEALRAKADFSGQELALCRDKSKICDNSLSDCSSQISKLQNEQAATGLRILDLNSALDKLKADQLECQNNKAKLSELNQKLDMCNFKNDQLLKDKSDSLAYAKTLTDEIGNLKAANLELANFKRDWLNEKASLNQKLSECQLQGDDCKKNLNDLKLQLSEVSSKLKETQSTLQTMSSKLVQCVANAKTLEDQRSSAQKLADSCTKDLLTKTGSLSDLQTAIENLKKELSGKADLQQINDKFAKELASLKTSLSSLQKDLETEQSTRANNVSQLGQLIQKLTGSFDAYNSIIAKLNAASRQIESVGQLIVFVDGTVSKLIADKTAVEQSLQTCQDKLADTTTQLKNVTLQKGSLETDKQSLLAKLDGCQADKDQLSNQVSKLTTDVSKCNDQLIFSKKAQSDLQALLDKANADLGQLRGNLNTLTANFTDCQISSKTCEARTTDLIKMRDNLDGQNKQLQSQLSQQSAQISDLLTKLNLMTDSSNRCKSDFTKLSSDFDALHQKSNDQATSLDKLNGQLASLSNDNKQLTDQTVNYKGQIETLKSGLSDCLSQKDTALKSLADLKASLSGILSKFDSLQNDYDNFKTACKKTLDENANLKLSLTSLQSQYDTLRTNCTQLDSNNKADIIACKNQVSDLASQLKSAKDNLLYANEVLSNSTNSLKDCKSSSASIKSDLDRCAAESAGLKKQVDGISVDNQALASKNTNLVSQIDRLNFEIQKQKDQIGILTAQVSSLSSDVADKNKQLGQLVECNSSLSALKEQANGLRAKLSDCEQNGQILNKTIGQRDNQIELLRADLSKTNSEFIDLNKQFAATKALFDDCQTRYSELGRNLDQATFERDQIKTALANCKTEIQKSADLIAQNQIIIKEGQMCQDSLTKCRNENDFCLAKAKEAEATRKGLETEVASKAQQIALINQHLETIKADFESLKTEQKNFLSLADSRRKEVLNKIAALEADKAKLALQLSTLGDENTALKVQIAKLSTQLGICDDTNRKLLDCQSFNAQLSSQLSQIKVDNADQLAKNQQLALKISQFEIKVPQLNDLLNNCQIEKEKLSKDLIFTQNDLASLRAQQSALKSANSELSDQTASFSSKLKACESSLNDCSSQKSLLNQKIGAYEESDRVCQLVKKDYTALLASSDLQKSNLNDCVNAKTALESNLKDCRQTQSEASAKLTACQIESSRLSASAKSDSDNYQASLKSLASQAADCRDGQDRLKQTLNQCLSSNDKFAEDLKRLSSKLDDCRSCDNQLGGCKADLQSERATSQMKDKLISELKSQATDAQASSASCQAQARDLQVQLQKSSSDNSQLAAKNDQLQKEQMGCQEAKRKCAQDLASQKDSFTSQLGESEKKLSSCLSDFLSAQKNYQSVSVDLQACHEATKQSEKIISDLQDHLKSFNKTSDDLKSALANNTALQNQNQQLLSSQALYNQTLIQLNTINVTCNARQEICQKEKGDLQANQTVLSDRVQVLESQLKLSNDKIALLISNIQSLNDEKRNLYYKISQYEAMLKEAQSKAESMSGCATELANQKILVANLQAAKKSIENEKSQVEAKLKESNAQLVQLTIKFKYLITKLEYLNVVSKEKPLSAQNQGFFSQQDGGGINSQAVFIGSSFVSDT